MHGGSSAAEDKSQLQAMQMTESNRATRTNPAGMKAQHTHLHDDESVFLLH